ncbi:amidohydrolase family protein [Luteimonas sp. MC1895]|uniref:N-acyl-D-amino-acid deacylase family protein n=1 Tax=Luteimonas sp. MC1895 TaxID=2819513 RepID=UPI0018F0ED66|nr:amidohydrolase family protein [Luteimonas sp. MC1895]MBJ6979382.1 amidohydrolase family protein [Luteimonas sp. MC1895]
MHEATWSRRQVLATLAAAAASAALPRARARPPAAGTVGVAGAGDAGDAGLLLRDVRLVDGSGAPARATDVLVRGDAIAGTGRIPARDARGLRVVEGGGRVLAPGFIDLHTHGDPLESAFTPFLAMGVTTVVLGQDGGSPALAGAGREAGSLPAWMDAVAAATPDINIATLSGHGALRRRAGIDDGTRRPSDAELERLQAVLEVDLRAGAFGLSTGLEYVPGRYAEMRELAALGPVVARLDGVAMSHMRSEDADDVRASIRELVEAAGPARAHVSHLKMVYGQGEAAAVELLAFLQGLRGRGNSPTADAYPYEASYTGIAILFPEWALPPNDYAAVVAARGDALRAHLQARMEKRNGPGALLFGTGPHAGRRLDQVAEAEGRPFVDVLVDLGPGGGQAAHFVMDRTLQDRLLLEPFVAIASDGSPGGSHPRGAGTFAKWIGEFAAADARVPLEEAVRKATSLPASILGLRDRGLVRIGAKADLVLFDPGRVQARADYIDPTALAEGFDLVLVNGRPAFGAGTAGVRAGRLLRRGHQVAGA